MSREQRLRRLEEQREVQEPPPITEAERNQRLQAWIDLYEARGWRPCGDPDEDKRQGAILSLMVRVSERTAKEDPTPETSAQAARWQDRLARFKAAPTDG